MGKHAIIVIKNNKNEYLQYFDKAWDSYLFLNCKMNNKNDVESIIKKLKESLNINKEDIKYFYINEKTHTKFSESAKQEKEYTHYFYKIELLNSLDVLTQKEFEIKNQKYRYFSYQDLKNNERIQKVNSDIVNYIEEFNL